MLADYIHKKQLPWEIRKKICACRRKVEHFKQRVKEAHGTIDFERGIILTQQKRIAEFRNKKPVNYRAIKRCKESIECHQQLLKGYLLDWRVGKHIISSLTIILAGLLHPTRKQLESIKKGRKGWHISTVDNLLIRVDREEYERRLAELELQAQF